MNRNWIENIYLEALTSTFAEQKRKPTPSQISKAIEETFPLFTKAIEKHVKRESKNVLKENKKENRNFKANLKTRWGKAFDLLEIFICYNLDHGQTLAYSYRKINIKNVKFEVLLRLHARSCQVAFEVLELLKSGFADGALSRWRTLYEISVLGNFLNNKPEDLSQKYLDYSIVESYQERLEFQKNYKKLGNKTYSKKDNNYVEAQINLLKEKYGKDFVKAYGWSSEYLLPGKRNFAGMEETVEFKHMRPFYKMANNYVHSGAKGFLFKLGTYRQNKVMLAGPSNYGLADPGQNTAYSLLHSTLALHGFEKYLEDAVFMKIAELMIEEIGNEFITTQKQIEAEEKSR
ncbi:DUF5677 domain-containing protein [Limnovirga soli]|uniref:Uncharacterized protein n=1 Tax=Limnovirga soli TaxID=2656915 RepID=A0A8J8FBM8_9BACT|nr:DUF5677 domain-containing protein [Limnovirga soli]NNV55031.1 hypothetical protein [Limnovirga soli]